jgi:hypothetical protein
MFYKIIFLNNMNTKYILFFFIMILLLFIFYLINKYIHIVYYKINEISDIYIENFISK